MPRHESTLESVVPEPDEPNLDIVAIHGLNPFGKKDHAWSTWTTDSEHPVCWIKKFLPSKLPHARVFLFIYDSRVFCTSTCNILGPAEDLLDELSSARQGCPQRKILFIAHSLGGIITKLALSIASNPSDPNHQISLSAKGIATFGTPHRGGNFANTAEAVGSTVYLVLRLASQGEIQFRPESHYVDLLRKNSAALELMEKWFNIYKEKIWITSFYEKLPKVKMPLFLPAFPLIVEKDSATLCADYHERRVGLAATHTSMCKFSSDKRGIGENILREIMILAEQALYFSPQDKSSLLQEGFSVDQIDEGRWEEGSVLTTDASDAEVMSTQSDTEIWDPTSRPQGKRRQYPLLEPGIYNLSTTPADLLFCNRCKKIHPPERCPRVLSETFPDAIKLPAGRESLRPHDDSRFLLLGEQRRGSNDPLSCGMCALRNRHSILSNFDEKNPCSKCRTELERNRMLYNPTTLKLFQEQTQKKEKRQQQRDIEPFLAKQAKRNQTFPKTSSNTFGENDFAQPFVKKVPPTQSPGSAIRSGSIVESFLQRHQAHIKSPAPGRGSPTLPLTSLNLSKATRLRPYDVSHSGSSSSGPSNLESMSTFSSSTSSSSRRPRP